MGKITVKIALLGFCWVMMMHFLFTSMLEFDSENLMGILKYQILGVARYSPTKDSGRKYIGGTVCKLPYMYFG